MLCEVKNCSLADKKEELASCHGKQYCLAHLPFDAHTINMPSKKEWGEKELNTLNTLLERGLDKNHKIEGIFHPGDFIFIARTPNLRPTLKNNHFIGDVTLILSKAQSSLRILGNNIDGALLIEGEHLPKSTILSGNTFKDSVTLNGLFGPAVHSKIMISGSDFPSILDIDGLHAPLTKLNILNCTFKNSFSISNSNIKDFRLTSFSNNNEEEKEIHFVFINGLEIQNDFHFEHKKVLSPVDLHTVKFGSAPSFHGTELHPHTVFPKANNFPDRSTPLAAPRYRALRLEMENIRNRPAEGMFFALEQESLLNTHHDDNWLLKKCSQLYGSITGYGQDPHRTFIWLLGFFFSFFFTYLALATDWCDLRRDSCTVEPLRIGHSLAFTMKQLVSPFSAWRNIDPIKNYVDYPVLLQVIASFQSALCLGLLALLLLALRWQFKRG